MNADNNDWLNWQSVIGSRKVWRFSPNAANSDFTATNIHVTSHGTEFTLQTLQVASMFCCRCRGVTILRMRWQPLRSPCPWAQRLMLSKRGWQI